MEESKQEVKSRSRSRSLDKNKDSAQKKGYKYADHKEKWDQNKYDDFLLNEKRGTYVRLDPFKGVSKNIRHQCNYCQRIWKPSPKQCMQDDYFCPSCALHHRNNIERFKEERFKWTQDIPNTFYLFRIQDPINKQKYIKYGRTQHFNACNRYSDKEVEQFKMEFLYELRGPLKNTTVIENFWKESAKKYKLRPNFSEKDFHGATECIIIKSDDLYQNMLFFSKKWQHMCRISDEILKLKVEEYENFTLDLIDQDLVKKFEDLIQHESNEENKV